MKKLLHAFLFILTLWGYDSMGQNWVATGNALGVNGTLGTTTNFSVIFKTNNTERGRLTNAGLWGIGTTAPSSKLHINSVTGQVPFKVQINAATKFFVNSNGGVSIGSSTNPPANGLYVSGNVGIGVAVPEATLHVLKANAAGAIGYVNAPLVVENSTHSYVNILAPDAAETGILFGKPASNVSGGIIYNNAEILNGLDFRVNGNKRAMVLTSAGRLGIRTASPVSELHISHDFGSITHGLRINQVSSIANYFWNLYVQSTGDLEFATANGIKGILRASDGVYSPSDKALKKNFEKADSIVPKIMQLSVEKYHFIEENDAATKHYGMMAQDVSKIFPELVLHSKFDGDKETWLMNYSAFGILAVKAIQELQPIIEEQKLLIQEQEKEITTLKIRLDKLEAALQPITDKGSSLNAMPYATLEQNNPNPYSKNTIIRYSIPQGSKGQINVYDQAGKLVKSVIATGSGQSQLSANQLTAGTYTYALLIDGKIALSKQMIVVK
jgi:hypothetical protein